jgi:hypothetical protein
MTPYLMIEISGTMCPPRSCDDIEGSGCAMHDDEAALSAINNLQQEDSTYRPEVPNANTRDSLVIYEQVRVLKADYPTDMNCRKLNIMFFSCCQSN